METGEGLDADAVTTEAARMTYLGQTVIRRPALFPFGPLEGLIGGVGLAFLVAPPGRRVRATLAGLGVGLAAWSYNTYVTQRYYNEVAAAGGVIAT